MTILVTGGAGFIGSNFVLDWLEQSDERVVNLDRLYHLVAAGETGWHGYAKHVLAFAESRGVDLKTKADAVQAVPTSAFPTPARRPHNSRLDTSQLQARFGLYLLPWQQGVERLLAEILPP